MPAFEYTVRDRTGKLTKGVANADTQGALVEQLRGQELVPVRMKQRRERKAKANAGPVLTAQKRRRFQFGVKVRDVSIFFRQFAVMINAGVSMVRCLSVLREQTGNARLKRVIADLQNEVEAGNTLSTAMEKAPNVFTRLSTGLVRAGEVGGVLDECLDRLAIFMEKDLELRRKVKSALTYPTLVLVAAIGIVMFLVTWVLPKFTVMFKDLGVKELPPNTQFLMNCSDFLMKGFPERQVVFAGAIFVFMTIFKYITKRTKYGRIGWDFVKLKVPVFGKLNHKIAIARFARTMGTLLVSGVPILQAMETVAGTVDNEIISRAVMKARAAIREGDSIGPPLAKSRMFPPMVVHMISVGEETGALDTMLAKIAEFYEAEVDAALESLTAALEPVMIVFLGVIVGFIVISMFQPMLAVISQLSGGDGGDGGGE